jgi:predicted nucleic acid-binding protein
VLYLDTGCLVKLYYPEPESAAVAKIVLGKAIIFTDLHELEMATAMQLKVFRGEANRESVMAAMDLVREDLVTGKLSKGSVGLQSAMRAAVAMSLAHASSIGCRSLDILHCALAKATGAEAFVSTDARQLAVARAESLRVLTI